VFSSIRRNSFVPFAIVFFLVTRTALSSPRQQTSAPALSVSATCAEMNSGNSAAQNRLTQFLLSRDSTDPDFTATLDCIQQTASRDNPASLFLLGYLYEHGRGVPRDPAKAAQYYQSAASRGHSLALSNLASLYQHGLGLPRDPHKAFDLYTAAAERGNSVAQTNLASMYCNSAAIPRDYSAAARWFRAAADQGDPTAQHDLGVLYYKGLGISRDLAASAHWEALAASQGDPFAETDLAYLYETGAGFPRDRFTAYLWYSRAISAGDLSGSSRRGALAQYLNKKQRDEAAALSLRSAPSLPGSLAGPSTLPLFIIPIH